MKVEIIDNDIEKTFTFMEDITSSNIGRFEELVYRTTRNDTRDIILDLSNISKIDSMSIAALIRIKNRLIEQGKTLKLSNPNGGVMRMLELSGLDEFLLD